MAPYAPPRPITEDAKLRLEVLARREREAFAGEAGDSALALWLRGVGRLLDFLEITAWEYAHANQRAVAYLRQEGDWPEGTWELSSEEQAQSQAHDVNDIVLHLRIETFHVFADVLLDRLAKTIEFHFGASRAKSARLAKHDHVKGNLAAFAAEKQLAPPPGDLIQLARSLGNRVTTYRNRSVVHANEPHYLRRLKGTIISSLHEGGATGGDLRCARIP